MYREIVTGRVVTRKDIDAAHPGCVIEEIDRAKVGGDAVQAVYVWETEEDAENDDGSRAIAVYEEA